MSLLSVFLWGACMDLMKLLSKNAKQLKYIVVMARVVLSRVGLVLQNFFGFLIIARASLVMWRNFFEADHCLNYQLI